MVLNNPGIDELVRQLSSDKFNLLMIGERAPIDIPELIDRCNRADIKLGGGVFPGIITNEGKSENSILLRKHDRAVDFRIYRNIDQYEEIAFSEPSEKHKSAILFLDGLTENISHFLSATYSFHWDKLRFIGGGCGSISLTQKPCIFGNEGFFENAAMMLFLKEEISIGVKHGWKKIAGPFVVNDSEGNTINEINWRPAFEVYQEVIADASGQTITQENFFAIAKAFPFGIYKEGTEDVVRDPIITNEQSITCVGQISNHSVVNILNGETDDLIDGAREAASEALDTEDISDLLVVDCISRALFMEDNFRRETEAIENLINEKNQSIMLEGVLSLGEISSYGDGYLEFFNKTIVVGAFTGHER